MRLARLLHELMPDEPSVLGLLALCCSTTRGATPGSMPTGAALRPDQDRARWDAAAIREGVVLAGEALRRSPDRPTRM